MCRRYWYRRLDDDYIFGSDDDDDDDDDGEGSCNIGLGLAGHKEESTRCT